MSIAIDPENFKEFLKETFDSRMRKNSRYSLRSFARDLHMNDSTLSKLLSGKRKMSPNHIEQIVNVLRVPPSTLRRLKMSSGKSTLNPDGIQFRQLSLDSFNVMADWYHDAILELIKSEGFESNEKYVSKRLGISVIQARAAIQRLIRLGLMSIDSESRWTTQCENSLVNFDDTSQSNNALKEYQRQLLELSKKAVDEVPVENRNHTSFVVAIDSHLIEEINLKIREFQKHLIEYIETKSTVREEVYAIQFTNFPLTKNRDL